MGLIRTGEAVNRIPNEVLELFSEQPWWQTVAMGHFAAHKMAARTHDECGAVSLATFLTCAPTPSAISHPGTRQLMQPCC